MKGSIREQTAARLKAIGSVDIFVGLPSFYCEGTIDHVVSCVARGLERYYPKSKAVIFISDGGSTDDTREVAESVVCKGGNITKVVAIYRGLAGKGSAFRQIFEAAILTNAKALAIFESDRKSIAPEWVQNILSPVLEGGFDFVAPAYKRYKFDGTLTNTIAYNLTRALYGANIRQPIGGDWALSLAFTRFLLAQEIWDSDIAKYGVDIWMTTRALVANFRVAQARLGVKLHLDKDPNDLSQMFYQVVATIFKMMELDIDYWRNIHTMRDIPIFGAYVGMEPQSFMIDKETLIGYYKSGFINFGALWREYLGDEIFAQLQHLSEQKTGGKFDLPSAVWVKIVYRYAAHFHQQDSQRGKLIGTLIPIYNARVASLIDSLGDDTIDTEAFFEAQAVEFERAKASLIAEYEYHR